MRFIGQSELRKHISQAIRTRREDRNLTLEQLAEKTKASKGSISKWESGLTTPSALALLRLSQALDCSIDVFFGELRHRSMKF